MILLIKWWYSRSFSSFISLQVFALCFNSIFIAIAVALKVDIIGPGKSVPLSPELVPKTLSQLVVTAIDIIIGTIYEIVVVTLGIVVVADYDASVAVGEGEDNEEEAEFCCSHLQKE